MVIDRPRVFIPFFSSDHLLPLPMPEVAGNPPAISAHRCVFFGPYGALKMLNSCWHIKRMIFIQKPEFFISLEKLEVLAKAGMQAHTAAFNQSWIAAAALSLTKYSAAVWDPTQTILYSFKPPAWNTYVLFPFQNYSRVPQFPRGVIKNDESTLLGSYLKVKTTMNTSQHIEANRRQEFHIGKSDQNSDILAIRI